MKLVVEDGYITDVKPEGDESLSFDGVIAFCLSMMEGAVKDYNKSHPESLTDLYDSLDTLFYRFMERSFPPQIQPRDFDLSDAGLLYAQDKIIEEAAANGITYEEALKQYEDKAKEYVRQKARRAS